MGLLNEQLDKIGGIGVKSSGKNGYKRHSKKQRIRYHRRRIKCDIEYVPQFNRFTSGWYW